MNFRTNTGRMRSLWTVRFRPVVTDLRQRTTDSSFLWNFNQQSNFVVP